MTDPSVPPGLTKALLPGEVILWIEKPARLPVFHRRFFQIFGGFVILIAAGIVLDIAIQHFRGETVMMDGEPMTLMRALPPTLVAIVSIGGFAYLWRHQFEGIRYVLTNRRALIYTPSTMGSYKISLKNGLSRDYTDSETSPVSGGYYTDATQVEQVGADTLGALKISNLDSEMSGAGTVRAVKSLMPFLEDIVFDPANLIFPEIKHTKSAQLKMARIVERYKTEVTPVTPRAV